MQPFDQIQEGTSYRLPFQFTEKNLRVFTELSGDDNPLHLDAAFARARGYAKPVVHGALILSVVSRFLGTQVPGHGAVWHNVSFRFRKPLFAGESAELVATVSYVSAEQRILRLKLEVQRNGEVVAEGDVQASLPAIS